MAISISDLNNAEVDVDHIADLATSPELTATDRFGNTKKTWSGIEQDLGAEYAITITGANRIATDAARTGAEGARDAAIIQAGVYVDEPTGRAAVADGIAFKVQGAGDVAALEYRRVNSGSSTLIATYPAAAAVQKPKWSGKVNAWPDPFFRRFDISTRVMDGRNRWGMSSIANPPSVGYSLVTNAVFDGKAVRRATGLGSTNLGGPQIWLDELGAGIGDTITVYLLFVGTGAAVLSPGNFKSAADSGIGSTLNPVSATGASSITASATPQWLRHEQVVPAGGAAYFQPSIYASTAGTFDLVAVWAFKGAATVGFDWPIVSEETHLTLQAKQSQADIASINSEVRAPVAYGFTSYGRVTASATSVTLDGTGFSTNPRDLVFRGWGETYTPSGVSFNAIRCKLIGRLAALTTSRWHTMRALVRTGAASSGAAAPIVAVGSIVVRDELDTLTDLTILLKDPITGALKTLSDADFSGGQYFVAVWAENISGAAASCGEPRGTMANSLAQSYYITNSGGAPNTAAWNATAGASNARLAFQHLLMTSPVEGSVQAPSQALVNDLSLSAPMPVPEIVLPPYVFAVQGRECNVYLDNLHLADARDYLHDVNASPAIGMQQNERYTVIPAAAQAAGTLTVSVHDKRTGSQLGTSKVAQLRVAAASAGNGMTKIVNVLGDSFTAGGVPTQTLLDIVAGGDVMGITLVGLRGTGLNKHEGHGGWTTADFTGPGRTYRRLSGVTGVTTPPEINVAKYTDGATIWTVQENALSGGAGTIDLSIDSGPNTPAASGTLTKVSGTGDATISYTSTSSLSGNPLYIGGQINYAAYLSNNGFPIPDWVFFATGPNDCASLTSDDAVVTAAATAFAGLDGLITSAKAAGPSVRIAITLPAPPPSDQDAFGSGTGQTRWRYKRNILIWARELIARYSGQEANRIYLDPGNVAYDSVNNAERAAAAPVNSRNPGVAVQRQVNGVHSGPLGYRQCADARWALMKFYA